MSSGLTVLITCLSVGAIVEGAHDGASGDLRIIDHKDCRVIVPPRSARTAGPALAGCADEYVIDVLWCYTPAALAVAGGDRSLLFAGVESQTEDANVAFANTGLAVTVRVVGFVAMTYDESGANHLDLLRGTNDGVMDEIHAFRDAAAGDIVALITEAGFCGVAYVAPSNAALGFQRNNAGCVLNLSPFRHELGHNLGSQHYATDNYGYFSYSSGHRFTPDGSGTEIGTTMAGNNIFHYSNPNVLYGGQPTGVPIGPDEEADNFAAFSQTVPMVADFRCSSDTCLGDVNRNFEVGFADVLALIAAWGECGACAADLDGNGLVEFADILIVIAAWGPCP